MSTDDGHPTAEPWGLQHASALFGWALAETNAQAISRRDADAELRLFDDGLGLPQRRPSSDSDEELRDAPADGDLGGGPLEETWRQALTSRRVSTLRWAITRIQTWVLRPRERTKTVRS
jgi:hypothetical protein